MFNFRSLFCSHEYQLVCEDKTRVNDVNLKKFLFTDGYTEWNAPVQYYMCKRCGKVKRIVIK